jgi:hypothetical protein
VEQRDDRDKKGTAGTQPTAGAAVSTESATPLEGTTVSLAEQLTTWAGQQRKALPGRCQPDFDELCGLGCHPAALVLVVGVVLRTERLDGVWKSVFGKPETRRKPIHALEKAAEELEELLMRASVTLALLDYEPEKLEGKTGVELTDLEISNAAAALDRIAKNSEHIPPRALISQLRSYAQMLNVSKTLTGFTKARSARELGRYLLTGYVRRATGKFRDRPVASLIAELGRTNHVEADQRMWRIRHYKRLDSHLATFLDFVVTEGGSYFSNVTVPIK